VNQLSSKDKILLLASLGNLVAAYKSVHGKLTLGHKNFYDRLLVRDDRKLEGFQTVEFLLSDPKVSPDVEMDFRSAWPLVTNLHKPHASSLLQTNSRRLQVKPSLAP